MIGTRTVKEYSKTTLTPAGDPLDLSFTGQLDRQEFEGITHTNGAIPDQGTFWIVGDGRDFDSPSEHQDLQERDPAGNHINGFRLDDDLNFPDIAIPAVQAMDFEGIGYNAETGSLLLIGNVANSEPKQSKLFDIGDGSFVQDEIDLTVMYGIRGAEGVAYDHVTKTLYVAVDPVRSCPDVPVPDCRPAGKAKLVLKAKKAKLAWRAKPGAETPIIGNPLEDTDYHLCLYDETAEDTELVLSARLPAGSSWSKSGLNVSYTSSGGNSNGITALNVATGKKNKIKAQGKGVDLPTLPLNQNEAVIVQLLNDVNECWESRFTAPSKKNNTKAFKDRIK
jgi:hypothetical protein